MAIDREFVKSLKPGREKNHYRQILEDYMANDDWAVKALKRIGVLMTAHPNSRPFLTSSIESHKKLGYWITLAYDNYWDPNNKESDYNTLMPSREVFDQVDTFVIPHHQTWGGVLYPYFWILKFGLQTMGGFEYVYCTNGDCILEKPENFDQIIDMLGDGDIIGCGWETTPQGRDLFNTTAFLAKTTAAQAMMKHFQDHLIPFENYEKYAEDFGNTESRFAIAIKDLGLKLVKAPENPFNTQSHKPGHGTWYKTIGFRHIHGEWGYNTKHKLPIPWEYIDEKYLKRKKT
jgi:hypothetical protein